MKRIILCFTLVIMTIPFCLSQQNLKEGYIIDLNNDTINGYIDYRGDIYNSLNCVFYNQPGSESKIFYPGEIVAYRFTGNKYYISRSIKTQSGEMTLFLEYLVNGITSLYYLKDNYGEHFFIEKGNDLFELTNNISEVSYKNNLYLKESNLYKGILRYVYSGTEDMIPLINEARFNRESMIKLSHQYHDLVCKDRECLIYENETPSILFSAGPVFKLGHINTDYEGFLSPFNYNSTITYFVGIAANLRLLSINEKLNFKISILFGKDNKKGMYSQVLTDKTLNNYISLQENKILLDFVLKYEYPKGKFRPTAGIGPQLGLYIKPKTVYTSDTFDLAGNLISEVQHFDFINHSFDLCAVGTIGLVQYSKKINPFFDLYYMKGVGFFREKGGIIERWDRIRESKLSSFGIMAGILF